MTREMLRPKRPALAVTLKYAPAGKNELVLNVHFGFNEQGQVREVFCLPFKSGTDMQSLLHQACIIVSVGLQHGATMAELERVLGEEDYDKPPRSILGLIIRNGAIVDTQMAAEMEALRS